MAAKNKKGFSLVEALLATALLGIVATGVILPFTSAAVVRAEGPKRTLAAKLACDLMEAVIWILRLNFFRTYYLLILKLL